MKIHMEKALMAYLRHFRELEGISQEKMAAAVEMSTNTYSLLERGNMELSVMTLARICRALRLEPADVLRGMQESLKNTFPVFLWADDPSECQLATFLTFAEVTLNKPRRQVHRLMFEFIGELREVGAAFVEGIK